MLFQAAQYAVSSDRIENLAKPKEYHKNFLPDRPIKTVFNKSAGQSAAAPNERLEALAKAKDHSNNHYFIDARRPEESIIKVKKGKNFEKKKFIIFKKFLRRSTIRGF